MKRLQSVCSTVGPVLAIVCFLGFIPAFIALMDYVHGTADMEVQVLSVTKSTRHQGKVPSVMLELSLPQDMRSLKFYHNGTGTEITCGSTEFKGSQEYSPIVLKQSFQMTVRGWSDRFSPDFDVGDTVKINKLY